MKLKKIILSTALATTLLSPVAASAASTPDFNFEFKHQLTSRSYALGGKDVKITTTADTYGEAGNFTIELYRLKSGGKSTFLDAKTFSKNGTTSRVYSNGTKGSFYMIFKKSATSLSTGGYGYIDNN
ncbi:hypothetical protein [Priestia sp. JNUCC 25]